MAAQPVSKAPPSGRSSRASNPGLVALRIVANFGIGLPFFAVGAFGFFHEELSDRASLVTVLIGVSVILVGFYVTVLSRPRLTLLPDENELVMRHPSMKPAVARMAISIPFFLSAGYLLQFTELPYVYPFVPFLVAMFFYCRGMATYWINHHTAYYVTDRRAVRVYRFLWLDTTEIPVNAINSISESRSLVEMLTGRGSVVVSSGIGVRHQVHIKEIGDPGPVAQALRQMMP